TLTAVRLTSASFSFAPHLATTRLPRLTFIYALLRHPPVAAFTACVATTRQTQHFGDSDSSHPEIRTQRRPIRRKTISASETKTQPRKPTAGHPAHRVEFHFRVFVPPTATVRIRDFHSHTWADEPFWK